MSLPSAVITPVAAVAVWYKLCRPGYILSVAFPVIMSHILYMLFRLYFIYIHYLVTVTNGSWVNDVQRNV